MKWTTHLCPILFSRGTGFVAVQTLLLLAMCACKLARCYSRPLLGVHTQASTCLQACCTCVCSNRAGRVRSTQTSSRLDALTNWPARKRVSNRASCNCCARILCSSQRVHIERPAHAPSGGSSAPLPRDGERLRDGLSTHALWLHRTRTRTRTRSNSSSSATGSPHRAHTAQANTFRPRPQQQHERRRSSSSRRARNMALPPRHPRTTLARVAVAVICGASLLALNVSFACT